MAKIAVFEGLKLHHCEAGGATARSRLGILDSLEQDSEITAPHYLCDMGTYLLSPLSYKGNKAGQSIDSFIM